MCRCVVNTAVTITSLLSRHRSSMSPSIVAAVTMPSCCCCHAIASCCTVAAVLSPHHCHFCCHVIAAPLQSLLPCGTDVVASLFVAVAVVLLFCCFVAVLSLCHHIIVAAVAIASLLSSHCHNCCTIAAVTRRSHHAIASSPRHCIVAVPLHHRRTIAIATSRSTMCSGGCNAALLVGSLVWQHRITTDSNEGWQVWHHHFFEKKKGFANPLSSRNLRLPREKGVRKSGTKRGLYGQP